jgi:hypothetical protein
MSITVKKLCGLLEISHRLQNVSFWYLFSLALDSPRHDLTHASKLSGLDISQFSRLLSEHPDLAYKCLMFLISLRSRKIRKLERKFQKLFEKAPWSVALIIDSTIHKRSSHKAQNTQRFNHGGGFRFGHQWTNVCIFVDGFLLPLPPIEFLTKKECKKMQVKYVTEPNRLVEYIEGLDLSAFIGQVSESEVVVLADSGYDVKKIQNSVLSKGWDFVFSVKSTRNVAVVQQGKTTNWATVKKMFNRFKRVAPKKTVGFKKRTDHNNIKRKSFSIKRLEGNLKGVYSEVTLLFSKRHGETKPKYIACSRKGLPTWVIIKAYDIRFLIECFHRDTKQHLGLQDAGLRAYGAVKAHVHWVYCSYLLLQNFGNDRGNTVRDSQKLLRNQYESELWKDVMQLSTRAGGIHQIRERCQVNIESRKAA